MHLFIVISYNRYHQPMDVKEQSSVEELLHSIVTLGR